MSGPDFFSESIMLKRISRHVLMLTGAIGVSIVGYNTAVCLGGFGGGTVQAGTSGSVAFSADYQLSELRLFDRTRYFVRERYVEPGRIQPEAMFDAALDAVEREVDSVLLVREPGGRLLHVSVGAYTTTLMVEDISSMDDLRSALGDVAAVLEERLDPEQVDLPAVEYALCNGMLSTLDPHSVLMPPDLSADMNTENQGEFGGLGITITTRKGRLTVEYPLEDTPAYRAGLKAGDHIVRIEEESTINMTLDEAVSKLRGPVGEPVTIMIRRDMWDEDRPFTIVRDTIRINPVEGELLEGGVGYLRIKSFHAQTSRDMDAVLAGFRRELGKAPAGLVIDLRDNAGGYLTQAIEVSDRFVDSGVIVSTLGSDGRRDSERASSARTEPDYPIIVLVNAHSASASEIVAGALRNLDRAAVLGERTFGKGSVQHLYENADDSQLKLTVAEYFTPGDHSIQSVGIPPDVELIPQVVYPGGEKDPETGEEDERMAFLLWRDRVTREADLDRHLQAHTLELEDSVTSIAYLRDIKADERARRQEHRDLGEDWEVQLAREVLLNAQGARRADVVAAAATVVQRRRQAEAETVREAFEALGVDWSAGEQPEEPRLELRFDLGDDGMLVAGQEENVTVEITNNGSQPVHQVMAVSSSDNERLDGYEYFFGLIQPGETRSWVQPVKLDHGFPDEVDLVVFDIRDGAGRSLASAAERVRVEGGEIPAFSYRMNMLDDGSGESSGDGDGIPEAGEVIDVAFELTNVGNVAAVEAFAKLRNRSGRAIDLRTGTLELGAPAAGETAQGRFTFAVRDDIEEDVIELELVVGDNELYDYGAVLRAGFYDYATIGEEMTIPLGGAGANEAVESMAGPRVPPSLELTRRPELIVDDPWVVLSGQIEDDRGVRDVIVFHSWQDHPALSDVGPLADMETPDDMVAEDLLAGEQKVYYRGGDHGITVMPFTVEQELKPGANTFVILAHDDQGLGLARAVSVYYAPPAGIVD
jgi:carboxyl-terminal processing protease